MRLKTLNFLESFFVASLSISIFGTHPLNFSLVNHQQLLFLSSSSLAPCFLSLSTNFFLVLYRLIC